MGALSDAIKDMLDNYPDPVGGTQDYADAWETALQPFINPVQDFGSLTSANEPGASPEGSRYYNTTIDMQMVFDTSRSKWLSVETVPLAFGRSGVVNSGSRLKTIDGIVVSSANLGYAMTRKGTLVEMGVTAGSVSGSPTMIIQKNQSDNLVTLTYVQGATIKSDINGDFDSEDTIQAVSSGGASGTDVNVWIGVKWRAN